MPAIKMRILLSLSILLLANSAGAGDGLIVGGSELGRADKGPVFFGFMQPKIEVTDKGKISFGVLRLRLALRGSVAKTDQKISYFVMLEAGKNGLTRKAPVVPTDLSVTLSYAPGMRLRFGQFKLPVMDEIVQPLAVTQEFIHFSQTLISMNLENPIKDGAFSGASYAFRDVGMQLFDSFQKGSLSGGYALMVASGHHALGSGKMRPDLLLRMQLSKVLKGAMNKPKRHEYKVGFWTQDGQRNIAEATIARRRSGAFVHVERGSAWGMIEGVSGQGALQAGISSGFVAKRIELMPDASALGLVAGAGIRRRFGQSELAIKTRFEHFEQRDQPGSAAMTLRSATLGLGWSPSKKSTFSLDFRARRLKKAASIVADINDYSMSTELTLRF